VSKSRPEFDSLLFKILAVPEIRPSNTALPTRINAPRYLPTLLLQLQRKIHVDCVLCAAKWVNVVKQGTTVKTAT
jgi:hypothetical protein